jgi:hypothetical protein
VGELLDGMTSAELSEWIAFDRIEPIGEIRGDVQAGIVASVIANVNRAKGGRTFKPLDFMPFADKPPADEGRNLGVQIIETFKRIAKR